MSTKNYNQDLGGGYYKSDSDKAFDRWCQRNAEEATAGHIKSLQTELERLKAALGEIKVKARNGGLIKREALSQIECIAHAALNERGGE